MNRINRGTAARGHGHRWCKSVVTLALATSTALIGQAAWAQASPVGYWRAIDGDTRQPTSIVRISEGPTGLTGQIQTVLDARLAAANVCKACEGDRRAKPLVGLEVIRRAQPDNSDPAMWTGGEILDPENGKEYNLQLKVVGNGARLEVRGYLGTPLLGRTQTWVRVDELGRDVAVAAPAPVAPAPVAQPSMTTSGSATLAPAASPSRTISSSTSSTSPTSATGGLAAAAMAAPPAYAPTVIAPTTAATVGTPVGLWTAIDGDSNRETSLVRIVDGPNGLTGRIVKMLDRDIRAGLTCTQCEGDRRGRPLVGLEIIRAAKADAGEPGVWSGGEVLDPENGKTYSLQLKPVDGGQKLEVRGYIGAPVLGRTQTWMRVE